MNFTDYERSGRLVYARFAEAIASILRTAIVVKSDLQLQEVQFRAKDNVGLHKKLEGRAKLESQNVEAEIKDLAGCRLIFYTNDDVEAFAQSGLIQDNFELAYDRTKIHYPVGDTGDAKDANALFISDNYVVKLNEKRSKLARICRLRWIAVRDSGSDDTEPCMGADGP